jgi:hypothetical protein
MAGLAADRDSGYRRGFEDGCLLDVSPCSLVETDWLVEAFIASIIRATVSSQKIIILILATVRT